MKTQESRLRLDVMLEGKQARLQLRVPPAGWELPLLPPDGVVYQETDRLNRLALILEAYVESLDDQRLTQAQARALTFDPVTRKALLELRADLLLSVRDHGRVLLKCPRCLVGESELALAALSLALGPDPWPVARADGEPALPSLAMSLRYGIRPPVPCAAGVRLALPCRRAGFENPYGEAEFGPLRDEERIAEAWKRWGRDGEQLEPETAHWRRAHPGFRATLGMITAVSRIDAVTDLTPQIIESLPMPDFLFVDAVYHLLHYIDILDAERCSVACPNCGERFLMVRGTP